MQLLKAHLTLLTEVTKQSNAKPSSPRPQLMTLGNHLFKIIVAVIIAAASAVPQAQDPPPPAALSNPNPKGFDSALIMKALYSPHPDLVLLSAHRGLHALAGSGQAPYVAENSLKAIGKAAEAGWETIEVDVRLTSDNVPILSHDMTWGREWCASSGAGPNDPPSRQGPYDPFVAPGSNSFNDVKDVSVSSVTLANTKYWFTDLTVLRDMVSLASDHKGYCSSLYGEYPPTLSDVYHYLYVNRIQAVLAIDVQSPEAAKEAWAVTQANLDAYGRPAAASTVFKMPATMFSSPNDYLSLFGASASQVNFIPVITTKMIAPTTATVTDDEAGGFDVTSVSAAGFGSEANVRSWLQSFEANQYIKIAAVEVVLKENGGILSNLQSAAQNNLVTGTAMSVANFNPVGEYYPNGDTTQPQFFSSADGHCCVTLDDYLYNNPRHTGPVDPSQPIDNNDYRRSISFIAGTGNSFVTTDDPASFANYLTQQGKRNISYMQGQPTCAAGSMTPACTGTQAQPCTSNCTGTPGSTGVGSVPAPGSPGSGFSGAGQFTAVPAYFLPTPGGDWDKMDAIKPTTGIAVANVSNGPNYIVDANYKSAIQNAHNAGIKVLGYVDSGYFGIAADGPRLTRLGQTDPASWTMQAEQDVNTWYNLYGASGLDGIFFDDGQNVCSSTGGTDYIALYKHLTNYVRATHPGAYVVVNPGTTIPECYRDTADTLMTFENDARCYLNDPACPGGTFYTGEGWDPVDPQKIWHALYNASASQMPQVSSKAKESNAGFVFITSNTLAGNPYGNLPAYFADEAANTNAGNGAAGATITPPDTPSTVDVQSTSATINWGASTDQGGAPIVAYDVFVNGQRALAVPARNPGATVALANPQVTVNNLNSASTYNVSVVARDNDGSLSPASGISFQTASSGSTVSAPGSLSATQVNFNDVQVSWSPASSSANQIAFYDVYANGSKVMTLNGSTTNADIMGLTSGISYSMAVQARDVNGAVSPLSNTVGATTQAYPGGNATGNVTCSITDSTLTFSATFYAPYGFHHVYLDADGSSGTGFSFGWATPFKMGADYLIENDRLLYYAGSGTDFNFLPLASAPPVITGNAATGLTYTWTIPRATFSNVALQSSNTSVNGGVNPRGATFMINGTGYAPEAYSKEYDLFTGALSVDKP